MIKIPNYTVKKVIGQGGMSLVYLAVQDMLSREVALKVLMPDMMKDDMLRKSFLNEAKIVASLDHPNIVSIYDIGIVDDTIFYMTMEYVKGGTLKEKLLEKKFSYQEAVKILKEITAGLSYAHDKGYIHRDIKPGNILFRDDGVAVLTDFGIAKLQDSSGDLTRLGLTAGTAQYMSPEQAKSSNLDTRSDIYSLGLVFFEILTGEKSFKFDTHHQAIQQHISAPPPKLPKKYAFLQAVINKALAKKPNKRYQTASEFFEAVKKAGQPSLGSSTDSTIYTDETIIHGANQSLYSRLKRKPYLVALASLGLLGIIGISVINKYPNQAKQVDSSNVSDVKKAPEKEKDNLQSVYKEQTHTQALPPDEDGRIFNNGVVSTTKPPVVDEITKRMGRVGDRLANRCEKLSFFVEQELSIASNSDDNIFGISPTSAEEGMFCAQKDLYYHLKNYKKAIQTGNYKVLEEFIYPPIKNGLSRESMKKLLKLPYLPKNKVTTHTQVINLPFNKYSKGIFVKTSYVLVITIDFSTSKEELQGLQGGFINKAQRLVSKRIKKEYGGFDISFKKNTLEATFYKKGENLAIYEIGKGWSILGYDSSNLKLIKDNLPKEVVRFLLMEQ